MEWKNSSKLLKRNRPNFSEITKLNWTNEDEKNKAKLKEKELGRLMGDLKVDGRQSTRKARPETVSEAEDEDEDEDDYDDENDGNEGDSGLESRYKQALDDTQPGPSNEDMSFMKYLHTSTA